MSAERGRGEDALLLAEAVGSADGVASCHRNIEETRPFVRFYESILFLR